MLAIYDAMLGQGAAQNIAAASYWAKGLEIEAANDTDRDDALVLVLRALQDEIDTLKVQLVARGLPEDLYAGQLARLRNAAAPAAIHSHWAGMVGNINTSDVRLVLQWAASVLPDDEAEAEAEQLDLLAADIDRLQAEIANAELPPAIYAFAVKQLRSLREALRLYRVRGVEPIRTAVEQALGAAAMAGEAMRAEAATASPKARTAMQCVNDALGRAVRVCDDIVKVQGGASLMFDAARLIASALG